MKKLICVLMIITLSLGIISCGKTSQTKDDVSIDKWEDVLSKAKGTTVNFYGWGGDQLLNGWIDNHLSKKLKEKYDITLNRVGMNIDEILSKLLNEKQLNVKDGSIDIVWINGENFFTARENELLYGPFSDKLPNFKKYIDKDDVETKFDFGFPVEGYESPYGKAQFVMIYDKMKTQAVPKDHKELMEFAKNNPGKFTYPAPPDFTGSAFVRNIIYDIVGHEQFMDMKADEDTVRKAIQPAIDYLKELKPYLWKKGETYPAESTLLDNMYGDNEVLMTMSYAPNFAASKIKTGEFTESTRTFVFDKGTIGNTNFLAIPFNSPNKEGALAVINYILSVDMQASKYEPKHGGGQPVLDSDKLNEKEKKKFEKVRSSIGDAALSQEELLDHRLPEMPANLIPIIEKIWMESIPNK
ncbi:ABC-type uncharacterized transport system, periplasmic component [Gottschalkia purinilytica]|uniref:ABC-type uncharacterized transport system, periplasmic component n=1 Tax=Gottschalkia purinilytica TaxID=1503 RepID=A0A0L0W705_GOTPU|nr:ABC transporter substrate-binding protein [Gottschalkia purinilytica]KNF07261.1 ABC-type uncharacterized transport system, periplasmic component [Gottschalkia purinilytica]